MSSAASRSELIADGIVDIIGRRGLAPGDALESSRDLARRFEVTTPTVREALRRLEATGVVEFRHGSGTYVGPGAGRRLVANPHLPPPGRDAVLQLVEARLLLEPVIARAAASARDDDHLRDLAATSVNALAPPDEDARPALHFHVALAAASGNPLLRETVDALLHVRSREQVAIRQRYDDRRRDHAEHLEIFEAVRDQDADAAESLTRSHLESIRTSIADHPAEEDPS